MESMLAFALAVGSALVFSFLCSISEAVLLSLTHAQVEGLGKTSAARTLRRFKKRIDVPIAAILVLNTIAHTVGASVAGATYGEVFEESSLWVFSLVFTVAVLFLTEIVPKTLGVTSGERLAPFVARFVLLLTYLLWPILYVIKLVSTLLVGGKVKPITSVEEIRLLAVLGRTEGVVGSAAARMIEGATALAELRVKDVMVPRAGVRYLSARRSLEENLGLIKSSGHSRFLFTPTGELDDAKGVILVKDLLFRLHETRDEELQLGRFWAELTGPLVVVPESATLDHMLTLFKERRRHLAVVVDEYGGIQGLVTLEDVLEEIVGEIEDETDRVAKFIVRRTDGTLICRGWAETRRVFEQLGIDVEDVESVTLGGFIAEELGRIPLRGDVLEFEGHDFIVQEASPRRAERIQVVRRAVEAGEVETSARRRPSARPRSRSDRPSVRAPGARK